jgi:uncharacterized protein (DUF433 family)
MLTDRIEINADVLQGKPVIRRTRIPMELLLRKLAEGATAEDLLDAYPKLVADDIRAALEYAADTIAHECFVSLYLVSTRADSRGSICLSFQAPRRLLYRFALPGR